MLMTERRCQPRPHAGMICIIAVRLSVRLLSLALVCYCMIDFELQIVLQAAADRAAAEALCEEEFWGLLEEQNPPLNPQSSWPALRRQVTPVLCSCSLLVDCNCFVRPAGQCKTKRSEYCLL